MELARNSLLLFSVWSFERVCEVPQKTAINTGEVNSEVFHVFFY